MQSLNKEQRTRDLDLRPAAIGAGWEVFLPVGAAQQEGEDLKETRAALLRAETVIRAQEARIHQLQQMAVTDELTGLANRRGFTAAFERELSLARRDADYGGLMVMIDLDGFKSINDTWGHQAGDAYLRAAALALKDAVRASDTVARLGGDEFALLLTHVDEKNGAKRVGRLEQAFNAKSLMLDRAVPLRASFGFAPYSGGAAIDSVTQSADLRLYAHKSRHKKYVTAGA